MGRKVGMIHAGSSNVPLFNELTSEIMTDEAMGVSDHIGILGSHPGALASTSQIIQEQAKLGGKKTEVKTLLCPGAFDALRRGDLATHDRIVIEHLNQLMEEVKVIVIPQPSIEKAVEKVPQARRKVPIMSSAHLSVERLKERLDSIA